MKNNNRFTSLLLSLLLSISAAFAYLPSSTIANAIDENETRAEGETETDGNPIDTSGEVAEAKENTLAEDTDNADSVNEETAPETEELFAEEVSDASEETEEIRTTNRSVLAFTSDTHNMSGNVAANRLGAFCAAERTLVRLPADTRRS